MLGSLFNKVAELKVCNFLKKQTPTQVFLVDIGKFFNNSFFYRTSPVVVSDSPTRVKSARCLFLVLTKMRNKLEVRNKLFVCLIVNIFVYCFVNRQGIVLNLKAPPSIGILTSG